MRGRLNKDEAHATFVKWLHVKGDTTSAWASSKFAAFLFKLLWPEWFGR
jgi:hypothetical protein